jgi:hypothetical protein
MHGSVTAVAVHAVEAGRCGVPARLTRPTVHAIPTRRVVGVEVRSLSTSTMVTSAVTKASGRQP